MINHIESDSFSHASTNLSFLYIRFIFMNIYIYSYVCSCEHWSLTARNCRQIAIYEQSYIIHMREQFVFICMWTLFLSFVDKRIPKFRDGSPPSQHMHIHITLLRYEYENDNNNRLIWINALLYNMTIWHLRLSEHYYYHKYTKFQNPNKEFIRVFSIVIWRARGRTSQSLPHAPLSLPLSFRRHMN